MRISHPTALLCQAFFFGTPISWAIAAAARAEAPGSPSRFRTVRRWSRISWSRLESSRRPSVSRATRVGREVALDELRHDPLLRDEVDHREVREPGRRVGRARRLPATRGRPPPSACPGAPPRPWPYPTRQPPPERPAGPPSSAPGPRSRAAFRRARERPSDPGRGRRPAGSGGPAGGGPSPRPLPRAAAGCGRLPGAGSRAGGRRPSPPAEGRGPRAALRDRAPAARGPRADGPTNVTGTPSSW